MRQRFKIAESAMVPAALSPELENLLTTSTPERSLPLAVRRFMSEIGSSQPEEAMQLAAERTLVSYAAMSSDALTSSVPLSHRSEGGASKSSARVSVERLCSLLDVDLVGAPQRHERSGYRSDYNEAPYLEHPARVEFRYPRPIIRLPPNIGWNRGRVAAAHEIGHVLIHKRKCEYDQATVRLGSSPAEEALAEYAARLLLLPRNPRATDVWENRFDNYAVRAVMMAQRAQVTLHAAVARLGDPDVGNIETRGAIFWRMVSKSATNEVDKLLTPYWHLCPGTYVPVGKCKVRKGSLIEELAANTEPLGGSRVEQVDVGTFRGTFVIDAFAWGSIADRTRVVLSVFRSAVGR